jgi:hypothetical protein
MSATSNSEARVCPECGGANVRIELRDSFTSRIPGAKFEPRNNGMWIVCPSCGHERPGQAEEQTFDYRGPDPNDPESGEAWS